MTYTSQSGTDRNFAEGIGVNIYRFFLNPQMGCEFTYSRSSYRGRYGPDAELTPRIQTVYLLTDRYADGLTPVSLITAGQPLAVFDERLGEKAVLTQL